MNFKRIKINILDDEIFPEVLKELNKVHWDHPELEDDQEELLMKLKKIFKIMIQNPVKKNFE
jgi:hypothetical protein